MAGIELRIGDIWRTERCKSYVANREHTILWRWWRATVAIQTETGVAKEGKPFILTPVPHWKAYGAGNYILLSNLHFVLQERGSPAKPSLLFNKGLSKCYNPTHALTTLWNYVLRKGIIRIQICMCFLLHSWEETKVKIHIPHHCPSFGPRVSNGYPMSAPCVGQR